MESIAELRQICQADKLQRSRGLTRLNRFVSIYATFTALALGISANALTVASIAAGLIGALLLGLPGYAVNLAGVGLLYVSFLFDQVDGEVARYHRCTITGTYLDEIRHILIYASPVFALSAQLLIGRPTLLMAGAGFAAAISLIILRFNPNARFLLYTKTALSPRAAAYGFPARASSTRRADDGRQESPRPRKAPSGVAAAIDGLSYVTTNQVSLLFLILTYVHILAVVADRRVHEALFLAYAGCVVALALLGVWKMAYRGRIESAYAETDRLLRERGVVSDRTPR